MISNNLLYWFSFRFRIINTLKNYIKTKNPTLSNRVPVLVIKSLLLYATIRHKNPDSHKSLLIRFIKIICTKSCHFFYFLNFDSTKLLYKYEINKEMLQFFIIIFNFLVYFLVSILVTILEWLAVHRSYHLPDNFTIYSFIIHSKQN
jgi:hypothetical protein